MIRHFLFFLFFINFIQSIPLDESSDLDKIKERLLDLKYSYTNETSKIEIDEYREEQLLYPIQRYEKALLQELKIVKTVSSEIKIFNQHREYSLIVDSLNSAKKHILNELRELKKKRDLLLKPLKEDIESHQDKILEINQEYNRLNKTYS